MKRSTVRDLPKNAAMSDYQKLIHDLETHHGWLDVDLIHNCFLMGEEIGELFSAIRQHENYYKSGNADGSKAAIAEELVDVFNYLLAIANRLDIDLEDAFRRKNARNFERTWG